MKTAMQQMIEFIDQNFQDIHAGGCANLLKGLAENLLKYEKKQIGATFDAGSKYHSTIDCLLTFNSGVNKDTYMDKLYKQTS